MKCIEQVLHLASVQKWSNSYHTITIIIIIIFAALSLITLFFDLK